MNPRPILIATSIAIALVAFVYFLGQHHFSEPSVDEDGIYFPGEPEFELEPSKPVTVDTV